MFDLRNYSTEELAAEVERQKSALRKLAEHTMLFGFTGCNNVKLWFHVPSVPGGPAYVRMHAKGLMSDESVLMSADEALELASSLQEFARMLNEASGV